MTNNLVFINGTDFNISTILRVTMSLSHISTIFGLSILDVYSAE